MDKTVKHSRKDILLIVVLCLLFLSLGAVAIDYEFYVYAFIPVMVLGVLLIMLKFYYSVFLVAFLTPLSIFFKMEDFSIVVPTEPILIIVMLLFIWECFFNRNYDKKAIYNPITLMIFINLAWILVASLFSWDIIVSIKFLISRLWFVIPCYFMMVPIFKDVKTIRWFVALYGLALSVVIIICSIKFAYYNFAFEEMNQIPQPFYNDHTAYGAAIGLFFPISLFYLFGSKEICPNKKYRWLFAFISICLLVGLVLSYARATWLSVLAALGVLVLVLLKIKMKTLLTIGAFVLIIFALFSTTIIQTLETNSQDSSGNLSEHITSMSNISTDASNIERINRWSCALRMFKDRPITGWGPGTYQFIYGSYQLYYQRTPISTNEGTLGNAHSEYIGPLCEQGFLGCLIVIVMFATTVYIGIKTFRTAKDRNLGRLSLIITLCLITYYTHGFMNNFLDTDKLSVPVWAMIAMVSSLYIYSEKNSENGETIKENNFIKSNNTKII
ncbi:MAG: O-antigen ligase family protein [Bacteroidales bacterium]|nr:O-antigen ligase family protein [Bacteroidales bacterium]